MLAAVYQPMIGAVATGLYVHLVQQLPAECAGYSKFELMRVLFQGLDLEPNESGRRQLMASFSRLEATGLVESARLENVQTEEISYEFHLFPPLAPEQFFHTPHLHLLLRDKVGLHAWRALQASLIAAAPEEADDPYLTKEDISTPFYEVFTLGTAGDEDAAGPAGLTGPGEEAEPADRPLPQVRFSYADIERRFPRHSRNRPHVEKLARSEDKIRRINYYADKYGLTLKELSSLLDEDGVFNIHGELLESELERRANAVFAQRVKLEEGRNWGLVRQFDQAQQAQGESAAAASPTTGEALGDADGFPVPEWLRSRFDAPAYNAMLAGEPHTKVLQLFIAENVSAQTLQLFSKLNVYYRLSDPVLNAMIHHMRVCKLPWKPNYIEKLAASLQAEQINSYPQAVEYFNKELAAREGRQVSDQPSKFAANQSARSGGSRTAGRSSGAGRQKPKLPVYRPTSPAQLLTEEEEAEFERMIRQLEQG